ncbi:transporter substrate-binding domain-containing protein [Butyrivibrio sp. VCB2006]|uniref:transporter substrate-binding domain-containing protein n=1 Tax=Butyrivibrio sp. VCB2006 TaxID=1280679 RepID=UPI00042182D8|nr:transporter substrate-binding domain-containing protein [Butyrivibrio sp. VCB2006]
MKKRIGFIFLLMLSMAISLISFPKITSASGDNKKTVRVGYYENEVFEEGASEGAIKNGYAYEYYRKISEYTGWEYEYVYADFVSAYQMLLEGKVDVIAGLAYTPDRSDLMLYPARPMGSETYSLIKHESDNTITSMPSTLNNKTIGVLNSNIFDSLVIYLDENKVNANIVTFNDYDELYAAFDKGELDVIAGETDGTYSRSHAEVMTSFASLDYYLCVSKDKPDLLKELNEAQNQLFIEEPDFTSLLKNKYFAVSLSSKAFTQTEKNWLNTNTSLKVGYLNNYLPYSNTSKDGSAEGIVTDLVPELLKNLGISNLEVTYTGFDNYDDMTTALGNEAIDIAFPVGGGLFYSEEDGMNLSNPVLSSITNLIYSNKYISSSISDFAVNKNNKMQYYYVKTHYPESTISFYPSTEACLKAVTDGSVKCTTLNGLRTNDLLKNRAYRKLSFRQLSYSDNRCFGVKIGNEGLLKLFNRGISILGQDYALNLAYQYSEKLYKVSFIDKLIDNLWIVTILVTIIVILIVAFHVRDKSRSIQVLKEKESARIDMENANRSKTVFLTRLSEDMRGSVEGIAANVNIAYEHVDDPNATSFLDRVNKSCEHLLWLIDDIHDFSSVESGQYLSDNQNIKFREFINDLKNSSSENIIDTIGKYNFYGKRILIVDSIEDVRVAAARLLKESGFEVKIATDSSEAVAIIKAAPANYFDFILMDIQAPNTEGYEAARQIRNLEDRDKASIPMIAVTADVFKKI